MMSKLMSKLSRKSRSKSAPSRRLKVGIGRPYPMALKREIKAYLRTGVSQTQAARKFQVSQSTVHRIAHA